MIPPVLCYHRIGGPPELGVTRVARSVFGRQMTALARSGWRTLTVEEFVGRAVGAQHAVPLPAPAAREFLLTLDDGLTSLAEHAYPLLAELGMTAATFLVTDYLGRANTWDVRYTWRRERHLEWCTVERWAARGFDFQSHTASHARLTWLPAGQAAAELECSRETLIGRLGPRAGVAVAYPFGAYDRRIGRLARAAGYRIGFAAAGVRPADPLALPRAPVYLWDAWDVPFGLRTDALGGLGRWIARVANRCAVGTSVMKVISRQSSVLSQRRADD